MVEKGKLKDKVALVTGSNRGIGKGIARGLAREGASVVLAARGVEALKVTEKELTAQGATILAVPTDVTDEKQVDVLFTRTRERFGRLDILVNNAGIVNKASIDELAVEVWDQVMAVNLRGPFLCTREAMRIMKKQKVGRIINIGSISAERVRPQSVAYSTTKHGIWGLTQVTAIEGREHGITCGCLHPGNTLVKESEDSEEGNLISELATDDEPMMAVDEVVATVVLMASLPPHVNMLKAIVLPRDQPYIGRG